MRGRRRGHVIAVLLLIGVLSILDHAGLFGYRGNDRSRYQGVVAKVIDAADGDTIDVDVPDEERSVTRIRLRGVDCPEIGHGPAEQDAHFGREAANYVRAHVVGRDVRIALDPNRSPRDRYGRLLAYVYVVDTGKMLNEQLIELGLGYADRRFDHLLAHRFVQLDNRAEKRKVGLWAAVRPEQWPPWRQRMDTAETR